MHQLDGSTLGLRQVSRTHMGAYLCIASNGVPPSVSKRITLDVECEYQEEEDLEKKKKERSLIMSGRSKSGGT